jgi:HTH-type transcriptional regulator/antitoxin HigA
METMSTATLDRRKYQQLLDEALPAVIHTDAEHKRLLAIASRLMERSDEALSREEGRLLELLGILIDQYEERRYPLPKSEPHKMLAHLLDEREMKPSDLWDVIPKSRVSEILSGKRSISKTQARQLSDRFHVPVDLFL